MNRMLLPLASLAFLAAANLTARAQDDDAPSLDDTPHITVIGTAQAEVTPDIAEIRLGVDTEKPTAADAWSTTSTLVQGIVDAAKAAGIKPQNIGTTRLGLFERFDSVRQADGSFKQVARGYEAVHDLRIRSTELGKVGTLTQSLIDKGANSFQGIGFSVAAVDALQDGLYGEALAAARRHAEAIARAGGVKLGRLLRVERPERPAPIRPLARMEAVGPATTPIEPGMQSVTVELEASYAIQ